MANNYYATTSDCVPDFVLDHVKNMVAGSFDQYIVFQSGWDITYYIVYDDIAVDGDMISLTNAHVVQYRWAWSDYAPDLSFRGNISEVSASPSLAPDLRLAVSSGSSFALTGYIDSGQRVCSISVDDYAVVTISNSRHAMLYGSGYSDLRGGLVYAVVGFWSLAAVVVFMLLYFVWARLYKTR